LAKSAALEEEFVVEYHNNHSREVWYAIGQKSQSSFDMDEGGVGGVGERDASSLTTSSLLHRGCEHAEITTI
jgi:hypothetical protein